ncbi:MAG: DUF6328 family protein [Motilibacteraceae bacterium]
MQHTHQNGQDADARVERRRRERRRSCPECEWQSHPGQQLDHAEWNQAVRGETEQQRIDRNFTELLQEVRVAQTGVQILFAFLLGLAFTQRFTELGAAGDVVYLATLLLAALAAGLLIAPVAFHRLVYARRLKRQVVEVGHRCALAGLGALVLTLAGAVHLAAALVVGGLFAPLLAAGLAVVLGCLWFVLPVLSRRHHQHEPRDPDVL